jgi:DNA helicase-2/ATP-dependent DNA helicase PcrA
VQDDLLADLNDPQRRAVTHGGGPLLVVAGPGSGKTRVVSRRVAWLLRGGASPREVLAVTFTNKAAAELRERVAALVPSAGLWVSTFHSACARILREDHEAAGLPASFTIYDEEDRRRHAARVLREAGLSERIRPADLVRQVSRWKADGTGPQAVAEAAWNTGTRELAEAYARYEALLAAAGAVDFDDLLLRTHLLLERNPAVLERYRARLRWILVDEYQDTNRLQFLIARSLASGTRNLCATGDPDQSIYGWRGADLRNILDFETHYPEATVVRLEENYRSTRHVLDAASRLIRNNRDRREKDLRSAAAPGAEVAVEIFDGADEEGEGVGEAVKGLLAEGVPAHDVAVFYRVNARSRAVERALRHRRIPYQVVRGVEFYQRAEVKDLVAWLRLLANPRDAEAFARVLEAPRRGAGEGARARVLEEAAKRGVPVRDALLLGSGALGVRGKPGKGLDAVASVLRDLLALPAEEVAPLLERVIALSGYREWLEEHWPDDHPERWENVTELLAAARVHDADPTAEGGAGLAGFLEEAALVQDQDRFDPSAPRVTLMTLHACKGLEFPCVFLVGVEEGVLPHSRSLRAEHGGEDAAAVEEERRLLFVGMTRAKRRLWLSAGLRAAGWAGGGQSGPSRFLEELRGPGVRRTSRATRARASFDGEDLYRRFGKGRGAAGPRGGADGEFLFEPDAAPTEAVARIDGLSIRQGQRVRHAKFGTGRVRRLETRGSSVRAIVEFREGVKTLDLDYVRLETPGDGA